LPGEAGTSSPAIPTVVLRHFFRGPVSGAGGKRTLNLASRSTSTGRAGEGLISGPSLPGRVISPGPAPGPAKQRPGDQAGLRGPGRPGMCSASIKRGAREHGPASVTGARRGWPGWPSNPVPRSCVRDDRDTVQFQPRGHGLANPAGFRPRCGGGGFRRAARFLSRYQRSAGRREAAGGTITDEDPARRSRGLSARSPSTSTPGRAKADARRGYGKKHALTPACDRPGRLALAVLSGSCRSRPRRPSERRPPAHKGGWHASGGVLNSGGRRLPRGWNAVIRAVVRRARGGRSTALEFVGSRTGGGRFEGGHTMPLGASRRYGGSAARRQDPGVVPRTNPLKKPGRRRGRNGVRAASRERTSGPAPKGTRAA